MSLEQPETVERLLVLGERREEEAGDVEEGSGVCTATGEDKFQEPANYLLVTKLSF